MKTQKIFMTLVLTLLFAIPAYSQIDGQFTQVEIVIPSLVVQGDKEGTPVLIEGTVVVAEPGFVDNRCRRVPVQFEVDMESDISGVFRFDDLGGPNDLLVVENISYWLFVRGGESNLGKVSVLRLLDEGSPRPVVITSYLPTPAPNRIGSTTQWTNGTQVRLYHRTDNHLSLALSINGHVSGIRGKASISGYIIVDYYQSGVCYDLGPSR